MNNSIRAVLRGSVLAATAGVVGVAFAGASTPETGGRMAAYETGGDLVRAVPVRPVQPAEAVRSVQRDPRRAVMALGNGAVRDSGLRLSSSGLLAECAAAAGGAVERPVRLAGGERVGRLAPPVSWIPVAPPADYNVPVHDPNAVIMLSKQVNDPFGGMTISGASIDTAPGTPAAVRELGFERCRTARRAGVVRPAGQLARRAQQRSIPDPMTSLNADGLARRPAGLLKRLPGVLAAPHGLVPR